MTSKTIHIWNLLQYFSHLHVDRKSRSKFDCDRRVCKKGRLWCCEQHAIYGLYSNHEWNRYLDLIKITSLSWHLEWEGRIIGKREFVDVLHEFQLFFITVSCHAAHSADLKTECILGVFHMYLVLWIWECSTHHTHKIKADFYRKWIIFLLYIVQKPWWYDI